MDLSLSPGSVRPGWRACSASLSRNRINPVSIQPTLSQLSQRRDALWRSACSTKSIERARNESHHGAQHYSCEWKYFSCLLGLHFSGKLTFGQDVNFFFPHFQQPLLLSALAGRLPALGLTLLGAGSGPGSCFAPPYRVANVEFPAGCPPDLSCCNEFGYCRSEVCAKDGMQPLEITFFKLRLTGWEVRSEIATV